MDQDYYSILQVAPTAEKEIIEAAYKRLALKYHPDHNSSPDATERMKAINQAFEVLSDPVKRAQYDFFRNRREEAAAASETSAPPHDNASSTKSSPPPDSTPPPNPPPSSPPPRRPDVKYCQFCGSDVPTKNVTLYQNVGMLIMRRETRIHGDFCKSCIGPYFWRMTLITAVLGWWGIISAIVTPFFLINNIIAYISVLTLPSTIPTSGKPKRSKTPLVAIATTVVLVGFAWLALSSNQRGVSNQSPNVASSNSGGQASIAVQPTDPLSSFTQINPTEKEFCGPDAVFRSGPGNQYQVLDNAQAYAPYKIYATNGQWYYAGRDNSGNDYFISRNNECAVVPTQMPPTNVADSSVRTGNNPPSWANSLVRIPERLMVVCTTTANIHDGPGYGYSVVSDTSDDTRWRVYGYVGDWFYLGNSAVGRDLFLNRTALCEANDKTSNTGTNPNSNNGSNRPSVTPTVSLGADASQVISMAAHPIPVCAPYGQARSDPNSSARVVQSIAKDGKFFVDGKVGEWYRGNANSDELGLSLYIRGTDLCVQPDPLSGCDDFLYSRWRNGKSEGYARPCSPQH